MTQTPNIQSAAPGLEVFSYQATGLARYLNRQGGAWHKIFNLGQHPSMPSKAAKHHAYGYGCTLATVLDMPRPTTLIDLIDIVEAYAYRTGGKRPLNRNARTAIVETLTRLA
jgi:hypothetical protein